MAKESLMGIPVIGKILKLVGTFGVKRGASDIHAVKHAMEQLKKGEYVVLFPEGTRVKSREEGEPKTGAAMLACRTGVPVLPVYIPIRKRCCGSTGCISASPAFFPGGKTGLQSGI